MQKSGAGRSCGPWTGAAARGRFWGNHSKQGFSLIEVFVVVVILGILSAIAVPMYSRSVAKTRQADAKAQLVVIQQAQEMYKLQNNSYATQAQRTSLSGWNEMAGRYTFSITAATATTFTAQASGDVDGDGVNDVWTINQDGVLVNTVPDV